MVNQATIEEPGRLLQAAGNALQEEYPLRLKWLDDERSQASSEAMKEIVEKSAVALQEAMVTWHAVFEQLEFFQKATACAMNTSGEDVSERLSEFEEAAKSAPLDVQALGLAVQAVSLQHQRHVLDVIVTFSGIVKLGVAFATASLAYAVSENPPGKIEVMIERMPGVAKNLGAAAVLGPVKDLIEAGIELMRKDTRHAEARTGAALWFESHAKLVADLTLCSARLRFMGQALINSTDLMDRLGAPSAERESAS